MDPSQLDDNVDRQWFDYVIDATVLANAVQQPTNFQVLTDADFELWWITATRTSGLLKVLFNEAATGRAFIGTTASTIQGAGAFNGINIDLWAGLMTATAAFPIAIPFVMPASRTYQFLFTDTSGAPNVIEIALRGFKLWPKKGAIPASGATSQSGGIGVR